MTKKIQLQAMLLSALVLGLWVAPAAAATQPIGFMASFSGSASITSPTTTEFSGNGTATHMGRITTSGHVNITGSDSSCPGGVANLHVEVLTAANGDTLTIASNDVACPQGPGRYHGTGQWTVTAGTGRFQGASGSGVFAGTSDFNAGTFAITLTGSVTEERS